MHIDKGPFPTFFASPGWIVYQVIYCICFGIIFIGSAIQLVRAVVTKAPWLRSRVMVSLVCITLGMGLCKVFDWTCGLFLCACFELSLFSTVRFLEISIDYRPPRDISCHSLGPFLWRRWDHVVWVSLSWQMRGCQWSEAFFGRSFFEGWPGYYYSAPTSSFLCVSRIFFLAYFAGEFQVSAADSSWKQNCDKSLLVLL